MKRIPIGDLTGSDDAAIMDAYLQTSWLVETDLGRTYCKIIDWKKAFGRVDWQVELIGDSSASPWINGVRFVEQKDPPFPKNRSTKAEPKLEMKTEPRKRKPSTRHLEFNADHDQVRNADDPMSHLLAEEQIHGQTTEEVGSGKRRRRRAVQ